MLTYFHSLLFCVSKLKNRALSCSVPKCLYSLTTKHIPTNTIWYSGEHDVSETGSVSVRPLLPHVHLRTETDPASETSCSLEYQTMDQVKKPSNSVCYIPSSEPFRIYKYMPGSWHSNSSHCMKQGWCMLSLNAFVRVLWITSAVSPSGFEGVATLPLYY
jgi:hypothetical protein